MSQVRAREDAPAERLRPPATDGLSSRPAPRGAGLRSYLSALPAGERKAMAGGLGNAAVSRALLLRQPDPNDPANYTDVEAFVAGATVLSEAGAREAWAEAHPEAASGTVELSPLNVAIYGIDRGTGLATQLTYADVRRRLGWNEQRLIDAVSGGDVFILRNGRLSRTIQRVIDQINSPSSAPALIRYGIEKLQADTAAFGGSFPDDYYVEFSKHVTRSALVARGSEYVGSTLQSVSAAYGSEDFSQGRAVLHLYEALARSSGTTGFDKVQHFIRSMALQYVWAGAVTDAGQYYKEVVLDEIPSWWGSDEGWSDADMLANNRGQAFGAELFRAYHPNLDLVLNPTHVPERVNEIERNLEREIYRLYNVPYF
jgi:hypothetical protein